MSFKKISLFLGLLGLLFLWSQCSKIDLGEIENLNGNQIGVIGHGGIGFQSVEVNLPTNTRQGIFKAVEGYGAQGVEVDVQLSADSVLFLYHDARLESLTDCTDCIYQRNTEYLENCRYRSGMNANIFENEQLIALRTVLDHFSSRSELPYVFLDLKTSINCNTSLLDQEGYFASLAGALLSLFQDYQCYDWVIVETTNKQLVEMLHREDEAIKIQLLGAFSTENFDFAERMDLFGLSFFNRELTKEDVRRAHQAGLWVTIVDVKIRRDAIEAIKKSPDFIYTDNIPLVQNILK